MVKKYFCGESIKITRESLVPELERGKRNVAKAEVTKDGPWEYRELAGTICRWIIRLLQKKAL